MTKRNGSLRLCGDYRVINQYRITHRDQEPKMTEIKIQFAGTKYFTSLDFNEVLLQVPLVEEQYQFFAFAFEDVPYKFTMIPYGTNDSMQGFLEASRKVLSENIFVVNNSKSPNDDISSFNILNYFVYYHYSSMRGCHYMKSLLGIPEERISIWTLLRVR